MSLRVQRMLGEPDVGLFERERVGDPENDESEDGGAGGGDQAIGQDAEPGAQLAHFFPPLIVDGPGAEPAQRDEQNDRDDRVPEAPAASLAAGNLPMTKGRVQGCSNCTLLRGARDGRGRHDPAAHSPDFPLTMVATGPPRKAMAVKRRIAALGGRAVDVVGPGAFGVEERDVGGRADGEASAVQVEHAIGTGGEQLHHAHQRDLSGMHQALQSNADGGFKTEDAERALLELLHFFAAGVRSVIGGDGVDGAGDDAFGDGGDVASGAQRRLHFVIAVVGRHLAVG